MDNDSRILDDLLFTSDIESETVNTTENTINSSIVTQNNIESFENIDANGWSSQIKPMVPYCFKGARGMKVKIPKTVEGFIELFFTEKLINFIHKLTLKKQLEKSKKNKILSTQITVQELKTFLSIYMQLGIKNVSNFAHCWRKSKKFVYNSLIAGLMSLERFTEINKMITMISKKDIVSNKLKRDCKTILYIESLFSGIYEPGEHISIDEGMMAFKGKMKNRVYSPLKPDKWGMKFYVCAESTTGYVLNMRICGEFSTLENTVKNLTRFLTGKYRRLYMDNYYNSYSMTKALISSEIYVCGTLRDRRGGPDKLTTLKKALLKGTQTVFSKSGVEVLIWNDKRPVAMITNCHDTRCVISDKGKTIPSCVNEYNKYMGGVDKFDQMIKYYPIKRKTNRWPNRFTMHILQILIHNAYVLYKEYCPGQKLDHFDFHCRFIEYLIKDDGFFKTSETHKFQHYSVKSTTRSDCINCRRQKRKRTTVQNKCKQCDVFLCVYGCFSEYHRWDIEETSVDIQQE